MSAHEWNVVNAREVLDLDLAGSTCKVLPVAVSLASQDGVYDLADLERALSVTALPLHVTGPLWQFLRGEDGFDLADLRLHLRAVPLMDLEPAELCSGEPGCDCAECRQEHLHSVHLPDEMILPHHAAWLARVKQQRTWKRRPGGRERFRVALVNLENIRVILPETLDSSDEQAVQAWVRENFSRVVSAAGDADARDAVVTAVQLQDLRQVSA